MKPSSSPITVTATVACWISKGYHQQALASAIEAKDGIEAVNTLVLYGATDREAFSDYIRIGEADITVRLIPRDEQNRAMVQALQHQLTEERVKWHQRQEAILAEISKLSALEFNPSEVE